MRDVVVTGASGFIGSHLVHKLSAAGVSVWAVCEPGSGNTDRIASCCGVRIIECDLVSTAGGLADLIDGPVDVVFHLAWKNASGISRADLASQADNISIAVNVISLARKKECAKVVVTGTVYENLCEQIEGGKKYYPISYYILTKRYVRAMFGQFSLQTGTDMVYLTLCHPIGKFNKTDQLIARLVQDLRTEKRCIFGSGKTYFDVIAAEDMANALFLAAKNETTKGSYFVGSGAPKRLRQYIENVRDIIKPGAALNFDEMGDDGVDLEREWLDCSEFCRETGFIPQISFEEAVRRTASWVETSTMSPDFGENDGQE